MDLSIPESGTIDRMPNRIDLLQIFLAAAEAASFREAAVRRAVSPQVVSRAVRDLESELGELLFHRSTRRVQLTDFGRAFAHRAGEAVGGVDALFAAKAARAASQLSGVVRVTAPVSLGQRFVWPVLRDLSLAHPGLDFDLRLSDALVDAVDQRIDLGVRIGRLRDSRFVARAVTSVPMVVCAAPALLARFGDVTTVEQLRELPTTSLIDRNTGRPWPWEFSRERQLLPARVAFATDDPRTELEAVLAGLGIGQLPAYLARDAIAAKALRVLLPDSAPKAWPLSVYRARRDPLPARLRLAFDALAAALHAL
jgi:DNA-binding transcriptional LysR family regulator